MCIHVVNLGLLATCGEFCRHVDHKFSRVLSLLSIFGKKAKSVIAVSAP